MQQMEEELSKRNYKAYLSFNQLREYLTFLVENDLIEYEMGQTYRTIERRMRGVLQLQNQIDEGSSCIEE